MNQPLTDLNLDEPVVAHVRRDFAVLCADQTVAQAIASLRKTTLGEKIVYFYVVDGHDRLVGVVPTRRLLMSAPEASVRSIMADNVVTVPGSATMLEACEFFLRHRFLAFPVVDEAGRMIGVVDIGMFTDEMFDVAEREQLEDTFQLIGVRLAHARKYSPWQAFRRRLPWLLCNVAAGIVCALIAGAYEGLLDYAIVLAVFVPVVLALAESVSIQSTTITLQALHHGEIRWLRFYRLLGREFLTAILLGLACGLIVGGVAWGWRGQPRVAGIIGATVCLSMVTACLLGVILPTAVRRFRGDPKIAAGPIVLAMADIATLLTYFGLAGWLIG
ncbi:MAG: magnesium transporter [Phycisphaerae bacterium]